MPLCSDTEVGMFYDNTLFHLYHQIDEATLKMQYI